MIILALNCGSSSVKYQLFDWERKEVVAKGMVERVIIGDSFIMHEVPGRETYRKEYECPDHQVAIDLIIRTVVDADHGVLKDINEISAVGHRVVHGGEMFTRSVLIDEKVLDAVKEVQHLAPLHNPPNIAGIEAAQAVLPHVPHVAIFDTAFHQTMPEHAYLYPLPYEWYEKYGVRRYGFHGTSHLYVSKRAAVLLGKTPSECNIITMHIGNGVSHCAIKGGVSVDTSMGLTPLEGAVMGTRCGDIDPAIPAFMMQKENLSAKEIDSILNKKSGVLGVTGRFTDRRDVIEHASNGDHRCKVALDIEAYRLKKYIGTYMAVLGRLDAVVFTAGVGEMGWPIREKTIEGLEGIGIKLDRERNKGAMTRKRESLITTDDSPIKVFVIPTDEELVFTEDVVAILNGTYTDHMNFDYSFARTDFVRK
ncbi:acetate kinase [Geobacter sulfurreducens]|uniref:Acetate kinase n=1 Tax=Geobacter sulfurreducens (strain ATCC 51573 / DSM 12127 / PCA) TaxID=243231 RepID=ACKA_GEOSL|nr:acetate kinase [Geobacter sulfurreducens]Q749N5.1 RecName: Full=Acetate kinase; AltName: Full=Acetokinase [Geobacter sulfurreducens PCA]AAR36079.1 acetate kinase [Geobacter sulfurreducens PCA]QVW34535.1 acetate kinase [Geobacter sulfurreducens]UAC05852.1 acetate kinase [Geobacter sulfurreducens]UTG92038.1 acetate kinase [Geobacter sulfurreducens]HBB68416.1 propionate kinase [Geobacter sulfurreducens]